MKKMQASLLHSVDPRSHCREGLPVRLGSLQHERHPTGETECNSKNKI